MTCVPLSNMISMRVHANQLCRRPSQWLIRQLRVFQELSLQCIGSGQSLHICPNQDLMLVGFGCISLVARIVRDKQCCCYILVGFSIDIAIFHWRGPLSWWLLFKSKELNDNDWSERSCAGEVRWIKWQKTFWLGWDYLLLQHQLKMDWFYTLKTRNASFDCIRQVCLDIWTVLRAKSSDVALTLSSNVANVATLSGVFRWQQFKQLSMSLPASPGRCWRGHSVKYPSITSKTLIWGENDIDI